MGMGFNSLDDAANLLAALDSDVDVTIDNATDDSTESTSTEPAGEPAVEATVVEPVEEPATAESQQAEVEVKEYSVDDVKPEEAANMQYNPNLDYSVKGETKQFDSRLASAIKTPEDEDYIRDLVTKAEGMDSYKEKLEASTVKQTEYEDTIAQLDNRAKSLETFYTDIISERDKGNVRGACKGIGLSEDDVLKFAIEIANERNLPAEERTRVQQTRQLQEQNQLAVAEQTQKQTQYNATVQNQMRDINEERTRVETMQLEMLLDSQHKSLADTMSKNNVDLKQEIINNGRMLNAARIAEGKPEITIQEAVEATVSKFAFFNNVAPANAPAQPVVSHKPNKPMAIPTVGGGSTAPVDSAPKSLADLQKEFDRINKDARARF